MTEFNLNKYQTLKNLYDEETQIGEHQETGELLISPTSRNFKFSVKHWRDNLENIIKNEM